ncbi:MAG: membrane protein-like protein [Parcubacteria bacterium C7867-006]|nr:MAG: membrane protein-like protein [Parcubacteria bacterium C7867-006]
MKRPVLSLDEIRKNRKPIRNVNIEHKQKLSSLDNFAVWITQHIGTMGFFFVIFFWTVIWLGWNVLGPSEYQFDPYPAFVFWLFISNLIQIFLMPLIMIGQNLQGYHAERRAEADFEVNKKAEEEIENILTHLENQNDMLSDILEKLNK